jgi:hypothetical protein
VDVTNNRRVSRGGSDPVALAAPQSTRSLTALAESTSSPTLESDYTWAGRGAGPCVSGWLGPGWLVERSVPRRRPGATPPIQPSGPCTSATVSGEVVVLWDMVMAVLSSEGEHEGLDACVEELDLE